MHVSNCPLQNLQATVVSDVAVVHAGPQGGGFSVVQGRR